MCDTFVALADATVGGSILLAKNADTEVNEAQHILKLPRQTYQKGAQVRVTHRLIPQARQTWEVLLDKSFWSFGGEIGVNEHGLAIGNEAMFSNVPSHGDGIILIDLLRLMLERCRDRHEAVELATGMLGTFGQGGNCELRGNGHFDGSFIIADQTGATILETAGSQWAWREVSGFATISNGYTIGSDWAQTSLDNGGGRVNFGASVGDAARALTCGAPERQGMSHTFLANRAGQITVKTMADLLRYVGDEEGYHPVIGDRPTRICMHAAPHDARFWQATGALIADTLGDNVMAWVTATSGTDVSVFKPVFFGVDLPDLGPAPRETDTPGAYWWRHERLHRRAMADYAIIVPEIRSEFEQIEEGFFADSESVRGAGLREKADFMAHCWLQADIAEARWLEKLERKTYAITHKAYGEMWARFNSAACLDLG